MSRHRYCDTCYCEELDEARAERDAAVARNDALNKSMDVLEGQLDAAVARAERAEAELKDCKHDLARCWPEWETAHQANDDLVARHLAVQARVRQLEEALERMVAPEVFDEDVEHARAVLEETK